MHGTNKSHAPLCFDLPVCSGSLAFYPGFRPPVRCMSLKSPMHRFALISQVALGNWLFMLVRPPAQCMAPRSPMHCFDVTFGRMTINHSSALNRRRPLLFEMRSESADVVERCFHRRKSPSAVGLDPGIPCCSRAGITFVADMMNPMVTHVADNRLFTTGHLLEEYK